MSTQRCDMCGMHLIIGVTGELRDSGDGDPDVLCLNCGAINCPKDGLEFDNSDEDETDIETELDDDEGFWIAAGMGWL